MNIQAWLQKVWQGLSGAGGSTIDAGQASAGGYGEYGGPGSVLRGLTGRNVEMSEVQAEVAAECRGQVLLVSRCDEAVRRLLAGCAGNRRRHRPGRSTTKASSPWRPCPP